MAPEKSFEGNTQAMNSASVLHIDANPFSEATNNCEPIIEAPPSPEPAHDESQLTDIEDLYEYDSDDVPIIRLSSGQFTTTSLNCVDDTITKALVPLHTRVASAPLRKLKHIERLRTEHQAYELPDTHPLLSQLERREPNDPCPYLLCILSPGFICVRGFDRRTRTPKRLAERLHRATNASIKARANKNDDQKQKTYASNSNSPQQL